MRTNGKIPDFTIAREGGITESIDFTMATVLACTHDAKSIAVARNREHANTHTGVGIKIPEARKKDEYPRKMPPLSKLTIIAPGASAKTHLNGARTSRSTSQNVDARPTSPARPSPASKAHTVPRPSRSITTTSPKHNSNSTDRT
mmetsp:Transcript_13958/g.56615  ORF Transcript_13958/g.56615 Transcript_13958/m.56615 type:complete len:145 (-) Transcript_13958:2389-2823(-)